MQKAELWRLGAAATAEAIARKEVGCTEVLEAHLARVAELNPKFNAIIHDQSESARQAAAEADQAVASGTALGPLHGVPITIKDNADQIGQPTTHGVPAFARNIATENAPAVENLLKAGAIVMGRTNVPEFNFRYHTDNPLFGATLNPWDIRITPGGSSGGAAVCALTGMGCLAHGSDLAGSLRQPAFCTGVATIKPTMNRVGGYNSTAPSDRPLGMVTMATQGPMARHAADLRLGLQVMAGPTSADPLWTPVPLAHESSGKPRRVAVRHSLAGTETHPAIAEAIDRAADYLADAGYRVEQGKVPSIESAARNSAALFMTECQYVYRKAIAELGSAAVNNMLNGFEALYPVQDIEGYIRDQGEHLALMREWSRFFEQFDLLLGPVSTALPTPAADEESSVDRACEIILSNQALFAVNMLGLPAAAVPTGRHDGLPVGVQIIGPRFREDLCLDAVEVIEQRVGVLAEELWRAMDDISAGERA